MADGVEPAAEDEATERQRGNSKREEMDQALLASRTTGDRSVEAALAEIQIITHNKYVQREERKYSEEEIPVCSCIPPGDGKPGCLDGCVNRAALIECIPEYCPCGDQCDNQRIQRGVMPKFELIEVGRKGIGMRLLEDIPAGSFVGEYMGEIVTEVEYHMRRILYHREKHRYMMVLSGGEVIDATRLGGWARFINHSCDPNCGVEKWDVNGEERCGIFALRDICMGEELTFDYKFQSFSKLEITECLCGSAHCRGVIGANNRVSKPNVKNGVGSVLATQAGSAKIFDPIIPSVKYPHGGKRAADTLIDRIARRRLLSRSEMLFLGKSKVFLRRNLARSMEQGFSTLDLPQYFLPNPHGPLVNVPPVVRLRALPGYPAKIVYDPPSVRALRLEELLQRLRQRKYLTQAT